ncbi:MAG: glucosidase [Saprospiraceae bacterium]|nr:glucosidase [Saprospiraceae bacterium]
MGKKTKEQQRLEENYAGKKNWVKWGPYLSERQWGTVREDYSEQGTAWEYFPHDHARSRTYRWGEDGIAGICDEMCRICFAVAFWNGKDPIIKERLFGLTGNEGNHGEDVKELYYYLDNTPSHSYMKHLYKYAQSEFPYADLVQTNQHRSKDEPEYEIMDTGIFGADNNLGDYFDVFTEYAKADEEDILIKITAHNRGREEAPLAVLPTLWMRNLWSFGLSKSKPNLALMDTKGDFSSIQVTHKKIGNYFLHFQKPERILFTENETNTERLFGRLNSTPFVKDSINDAVVQGNFDLFDHKINGTKCSPLYRLMIQSGGSVEIRLRLSKLEYADGMLGADFDSIFSQQIKEAETFYTAISSVKTDSDLRNIQRQAFAGMLWTKQYFNIDIPRWLNGDPGQPPPPEARKNGRNSNWLTLNNEDVISMPDKWEYPWYAAWDLAFHCVPIAQVDPDFAKNQLLLFLREWYMLPNGQLPAYEWAFSDVNPPVHAWACMEVYRIEKKGTGKGDIRFLKRAFQKLLINFTWWVNRKDRNDNNVFEGGFLGLDNIGVFDRSATLPGGGHLEQADGTSWMSMYCLNMLDMALEIAQEDDTYEDVATKFLEHFIYIAESLNRISEDWTGSWDEEEGFFYDILALPDGRFIPLKVRSLVGLTTLFASLTLDSQRLQRVPEFMKRLNWFRKYRQENNSHLVIEQLEKGEDILLSLVPRSRLEKLLRALLDENEFFSPGGIRSLSKIHETPYVTKIDGQSFGLQYEPAESRTSLFGGNSNWRGPVWLPMNYLLIQSLRQLDYYYKDELLAECPTGSGRSRRLNEVADDLSNRIISLFKADSDGRRPLHGDSLSYQNDPHFKDLILFYEYFHGDNGRGVGASHQTGWTGVVAELINCISQK